MNADSWDRLATLLSPENLFEDEKPAERTPTEDEALLARLRERIAAEIAGLRAVEAALSAI